MSKRILTAVIGIAVLMPFVIFSHTWALVVMTSVLATVSSYEILKCTGQVKKLLLLIICATVGIAAQILAKTLSAEMYTSVMMLIYGGFIVLVLTYAVFSKGALSLGDAGRNAVMIIYSGFGFSCMVLLRNIPDSGMILFLLTFFIPWVCDAMAYFVGVAIGKHKLIPDVSPKKTVEGAVGGIVGVVTFMTIFAVIMQFGFDRNPNYPVLLLLAFVGGFVGQCGDLIASLLKRECGIKDYGNIFPGHGGIMDRFDSNISVAIFMYIVCRIFSGVTII